MVQRILFVPRSEYCKGLRESYSPGPCLHYKPVEFCLLATTLQCNNGEGNERGFNAHGGVDILTHLEEWESVSRSV